MKKTFILIIFFCVTSFITFAQKDTLKIKTKYYTSIGLSIGNVNSSDVGSNTFNKASYPSIEIGLMCKNISLGAVFGVENIFATSSTRGFYELKSSLSYPIGNFNAYVLFGVGSYFEHSFNNFIEYGGGFSYSPSKLGYFIQYSNWARSNYVSVGIIINY